ncbi:exonuclease 1 [Frankliniella occidentalis]|uniref:Exonuclease 1 n=1 Tax=Frankliniella occidentalis TaxID=133901 RepID=A0A6J1SLI4_FRAOC|nr:exonuclease 1 [Frankliniella occidentalis]
MGITGLLPFLEKSKVSRPINIKELKGCTVAADAYCWLHKGAFACADKLARGEETDMYVQYCMKYVNMLLANEIKPILVFDGRHLPAKAQTEKKRRAKREENRKQAANLLRQGHTTEALSFLRRCIDVTHKMALTLMQECRRRNIDCIVAPYEADAQLAFFSLEGIVDVVITEDSDLLLFGCKKVLFKLDLAGNGILVDHERLYMSMGTRPETYSFDKFRYMCILSGCDYLDSLPGIGLGKACKFISRTQDPDIHKALSRLPSQLNIRGLTVSMDYRDEFMKAHAMFKHQLVFDPISKTTKPLTPHGNVHPASPLAAGPLPGCVPEFDEETSYQLALGNLDPFKLEKVDDYDPSLPRNEKQGVKTTGWNQTAVAPHPSIWDPQFIAKMASMCKPRVVPSFMPSEGRPSTKGKTKAFDTSDILKKNNKRALEEDDDFVCVKRPSMDPTDSKLTAIYTSPVSKKPQNDDGLSPLHELANADPQDSPISPILSGKRSSRNPFARSSRKSNESEIIKEESSLSSPATSLPSKTPSKFGALSKFARATQRTSTEGKPIVQSRYFGSINECSSDDSKELHNSPSPSLLRDVSNTIEDSNENEKEFSVLQIYKMSPEKQSKTPMIHRKPLFSSLSNSPKKECEDVFKCGSGTADTLKSMNDRFKKENAAPLLKSSPTKNPFKKETPPENNLIKVSQEIEGAKVSQRARLNNPSDVEQDGEDVDDPGFESSTSLTPCSPNEVPSQPDDGFESPSKLLPHTMTSPTNSVSRKPTPKMNKPACRTPGLKKPPPAAHGQSMLSAFGFVSKPKIQRT